MTNKKNTRRALFMSITSLILCCAMLMGTTFAWFTDSVTSGNNIIKSGNLDIEMYYADGTRAVPADGSAQWTDASKGAMFSYDLWEPGYTDVRHIKIENKGSLDLKYQLMIQANGTVSDLSDAIDVYFVNPATQIASRSDLNDANKVDTLTNVLANIPSATSGTLDAGEKATVTLALKMRENAGNEYQGKSIGADFSVILTATQLTSEEDVFGPDYDKDAWTDALVVLTAEDLAAAVANGGKIMLGDNVALTETLVIPEGVTVNMNLNGKTLSNAADYIFENNGNLTIDGNGTATGMGIIRSYSGTVTINGGNYYASSKWQDSAYQHTLKAVNSNVVINGGNFDATVNGQSNAMLNASENAIITINGGNFKNVTGELTQFDPYIATYEKNGQIVIKDGTFYGGWRFNGETAATDIYGGTFTVSYDGQSFHASSNHAVNVYGGTFNSAANAKLTDKIKDNSIVADGYIAINNNGTWTVKAEGTEAVADGLYQNGNTYYVENAAGLSYLSAKALTGNNGTAESVIIELQNDIDMVGDSFSAMIAQRGDALTFKGNNHTISNVNIVSGDDDNTTGSAAMFYCYPNSTLTVSDLKLENLAVTTEKNDSGFGAAVVGYCEGATTLNNVDVINATINGVKSSGMLAGHVGNGGTLTATNCDVSGSVTLREYENGGHYAAKYVGTAAGPISLNNCTANVTVGGNLKDTNVGNVYGRIVSLGTVTVDGVALTNAATQDALNSAVNTNGNTAITLAAGEYKMPTSGATGTITITGTKDTVIDNTLGAYMENATVSFEGVTIKGSTGKANGNGSDYAALYTPNVTYTNCTFDGPFRIGRDGATFINCTFTNLGNDYIWTYGNDATFKNCSFETDGKALLIYSDGGNEVSKVVVENCTFNATAGAKAGAIANQNCAAIEIHNYGNGVDLTTSGNSYGSNFSGEWRIKTYETGKPKVFVNGTEYTTIAIDGKTMTIADKNVTVND